LKVWQIAVGSTRVPKLNAVKEAAAAIGTLLGGATTLEVAGYEVESGVSHTPVSREELMRGARQRTEALEEKLRSEGSAADFYVGLEGGLDAFLEDGRKRVFLESWAYVSNGSEGHFGCSGGIEIPESLAEKVLSSGIELAIAIDQFAGQVGIRDGQGAWGVLSGNLISRQDSFRLGVVGAFGPVYNARMYRARSATKA